MTSPSEFWLANEHVLLDQRLDVAKAGVAVALRALSNADGASPQVVARLQQNYDEALRELDDIRAAIEAADDQADKFNGETW